VDATHSNIAAHWAGEEPWPDAQQLAGLRAADVLHEESLEEIAGDGAAFDIRLPMPGIARLRLRPA